MLGQGRAMPCIIHTVATTCVMTVASTLMLMSGYVCDVEAVTLSAASFPGFPDMLICTQKWTDRWRIGYKIICIIHFFLPIAIVVSCKLSYP